MIGRWLANAWEAYRKNWLKIVGALIVAYAVLFAAAAVAALAAVGLTVLSGGPDVPGITVLVLTALASALAYFLAGVWVSTALLVAYRDALSGAVSIRKALSEGARYYARMLVLMVIVILVTGVLTGAGLILLEALGSAGLIVAAIPWLTALAAHLLILWAPAYVVLEDAGAAEALRKSFKHTVEKAGVLLRFVLTAIALAVVGAAVSFVPVVGTLAAALVVAPLVGMVYVQAARE